MKPEVTYHGFLDMQVCVPADWNDEQVKAFADDQNPCGTTHGWAIRRESDSSLPSYTERVQCADRKSHVHIMLDA